MRKATHHPRCLQIIMHAENIQGAAFIASTDVAGRIRIGFFGTGPFTDSSREPFLDAFEKAKASSTQEQLEEIAAAALATISNHDPVAVY